MIAPLSELDEDALIQILTKPKNALIKQYQALFGLEKVNWISHGSIKSNGEKALERKRCAWLTFYRRISVVRYNV